MTKLREYRLPSGVWTTDTDKFSEAWDQLRKPLEAMGFQIKGFDPGISMCNAENGQGYFQLPIYAVCKFLNIDEESLIK